MGRRLERSSVCGKNSETSYVGRKYGGIFDRAENKEMLDRIDPF